MRALFPPSRREVQNPATTGFVPNPAAKLRRTDTGRGQLSALNPILAEPEFTELIEIIRFGNWSCTALRQRLKCCGRPNIRHSIAASGSAGQRRNCGLDSDFHGFAPDSPLMSNEKEPDGKAAAIESGNIDDFRIKSVVQQHPELDQKRLDDAEKRQRLALKILKSQLACKIRAHEASEPSEASTESTTSEDDADVIPSTQCYDG